LRNFSGQQFNRKVCFGYNDAYSKKSEFTLPATMEVDIKNIYKNSVSFFLGKDVQIGAKGTTKVGKGGLYVTIPFTYQGRHKLNLF
jgi:hypothetical protein